MDHPNRSGKRRSLAEGIAEGVERRLSSCMDRQESRTALIGHGHDFQKTTFHKLTYCHFCTDLLWGLSGQGFVCQGEETYLLSTVTVRFLVLYVAELIAN